MLMVAQTFWVKIYRSRTRYCQLFFFQNVYVSESQFLCKANRVSDFEERVRKSCLLTVLKLPLKEQLLIEKQGEFLARTSKLGDCQVQSWRPL